MEVFGFAPLVELSSALGTACDRQADPNEQNVFLPLVRVTRNLAANLLHERQEIANTTMVGDPAEH